MSRSRTAFALGLVVPLLVVGGCSSDEPQPRIAPSESPSPTDSPSAAELDPIQTVRAWVEAQNDANGFPLGTCSAAVTTSTCSCSRPTGSPRRSRVSSRKIS